MCVFRYMMQHFYYCKDFILVIPLIFFDRWGTFMHLIAITEIPSPFGKTVADVEMSGYSFKKEKGKIAVEFCEKLMAEPMPDYPSDESIEEDRKEQERKLVREQIINNAETGNMFDFTFCIVSHINGLLNQWVSW